MKQHVMFGIVNISGRARVYTISMWEKMKEEVKLAQENPLINKNYIVYVFQVLSEALLICFPQTPLLPEGDALQKIVQSVHSGRIQA